MTIHAFSFTKIFVTDLDAMDRFYTEVLGLKRVVRLGESGDGPLAQEESILSVSGTTDDAQLLLVRYVNRPAPPIGEAWTGFAVDDVDAVTAAVLAAGGSSVSPAHDVTEHGLRVGVVADPEGHVIELLQRLG